MKLYRFVHQGTSIYGVLRDGYLYFSVPAGSGSQVAPGVERVALSEATVLAPVTPTKVVALGLNYRDHAKEMGLEPPAEPILFIKPSSSVIGPGEAILYPPGGITQRVDYEAELAIVIGKECKAVAADQARQYIMGYTCLNDVTARDLQTRDGQWTRAKSFDTFCPLGPCIETELDPSSLRVRALLNGQPVQDSNTRELVFAVPAIVEQVSRVMTLYPGDVIATGTPPGIGPMNPGDEISIEVEGIGTLTNPVQAG